MAVDDKFGVRTRVLEPALEGADNRPSGLALQMKGFPAVDAAVAGDGQDRGKPVIDAAVRRLEVDQGIVAAIDSGNHDAGSSKIKPNSHDTLIVRRAGAWPDE